MRKGKDEKSARSLISLLRQKKREERETGGDGSRARRLKDMVTL